MLNGENRHWFAKKGGCTRHDRWAASPRGVEPSAMAWSRNIRRVRGADSTGPGGAARRRANRLHSGRVGTWWVPSGMGRTTNCQLKIAKAHNYKYLLNRDGGI